VPKLCPKYVRDIQAYLKISNSIETPEPLKTSLLQCNSFILFTLDFSTASYKR
jgi:hypothetical protein